MYQLQWLFIVCLMVTGSLGAVEWAGRGPDTWSRVGCWLTCSGAKDRSISTDLGTIRPRLPPQGTVMLPRIKLQLVAITGTVGWDATLVLSHC